MKSQKDLLAKNLDGVRILLRADLNVPRTPDGTIRDATRLTRITHGIEALAEAGARVIIIAHFGRPKNGYEPALSLASCAKELAKIMCRPVAFAADCIGTIAHDACKNLNNGDIIVLENTRFHAGETKNKSEFARALAKLADVYVNDAFSAAHRAHASTEGVTHYLPAYAGETLAAECDALTRALTTPTPPVIAIIGGAKISTKIAVLENLVRKMAHLVIGGGMANSFLAAQGYPIGISLCEPSMLDTARTIIAQAKAQNCTLILPEDVIVAPRLGVDVPYRCVPITKIDDNEMILDCGMRSVATICDAVDKSKTLVWNGPMGAFEMPPFDTGTNAVAQHVAKRTQDGKLLSIAGGGDTLAALAQAGSAEQLSYLSTAGGAFLEWIGGRVLPGIAALQRNAQNDDQKM